MTNCTSCNQPIPSVPFPSGTLIKLKADVNINRQRPDLPAKTVEGLAALRWTVSVEDVRQILANYKEGRGTQLSVGFLPEDGTYLRIGNPDDYEKI